MSASSLIEQVRYQVGVAGGAVRSGGVVGAIEACSLREVLAVRITDPRCRRGRRYRLASLLSVLIAGVACGSDGFLAIADAVAGWDQDVLGAHGVRIKPGHGRLPGSQRVHVDPAARPRGRRRTGGGDLGMGGPLGAGPDDAGADRTTW